MHVSAINNTNRNYNTRMNFGNKTKQATTVAQNVAQKAEPLTLTIAGITYTGATTLEVVSRYLTGRLGMMFGNLPANYYEHGSDYDKYPRYFNFETDMEYNTTGLLQAEIFCNIVKATGNDPNDDTIEMFETVGDVVDFLDSHLPVNQ